MENIYDVKDDRGGGNFYREFYIQVSKFDFARAVTKTFWTMLADVDSGQCHFFDRKGTHQD